MLVDYNKIKNTITKEQKQTLYNEIYLNPYIPDNIQPYYEQQLILLDENLEKKPGWKLVSGGAFSGKSEFVAMDICRYLLYPRFRGLVIRNTYKEITASGEVVDKLEQWLCDKDRLGSLVCTHNHQKMYFETSLGARIYYGYVNREDQMKKMRGTSYHHLWVVEASEIPGVVLDFLPRSIRSPDGLDRIPESYTLVSNPSFGVGVDWLKKMFINDDAQCKHYRLELMMNPHVDRIGYDKQLAMMSPEAQAFMRFGDWDFVAADGLLISGDQFDQNQIKPQDYNYDDIIYSIIGVDMAGTGRDYTSLTHICLMKYGKLIIDDNVHIQNEHVERIMKYFIKKQKEKHALNNVVIEQEAGSMTTHAIQHFIESFEEIQDNYRFSVEAYSTKSQSKFERARPVADNIINGNVLINTALPNKLRLRNQFMYLDPDKQIMKKHESPDFVDSVSIAFNYMIDQLNVEQYFRISRSD